MQLTSNVAVADAYLCSHWHTPAGLKLGREACSVIPFDLTHDQSLQITSNRPTHLVRFVLHHYRRGRYKKTLGLLSLTGSTILHPSSRYVQPKRHLFHFHSTMLPYRYSALPLPEAGKHTRLLRLSPGGFLDDLHVELEQVLLDGTPNYEALSYVWGSPADPVPILVGPSREHTISVTQNLATALRYLRDVHSSRVLWVDAVCINQSDLAERSYQVTLMSHIYRAACQVIAWIGPEEDDSLYAIDVMHDIGSSIDVDWISLTFKPKVEISNPHSGMLEELLTNGFQDQEALAVSRLLHRQWFERLWIRQEIGLATQAIICCGRHSMPWHLFKNAFFLIYMECAIVMASLGDQYASFVSRILLLYETCTNSVYYLQHSRYALAQVVCADPRDKIYGILSLLAPYQQNMDIIPDYTQDVAFVYQDATIRYINHTRYLSMLQQCELQDTPSNMPTWVPDWSTEPKTRRHLGGTSNSSAYFKSIATSKGERMLSVAGVAVATIKHVQLMHFSNGEDVFQNMLTALWKIVISNSATLNDKEISQLSAVCDALCVGLFRHGTIPVHENNPEFKSAVQTFESILTTNSPLVEDPDSVSHWNRYKARVRSICRNRSFFVTTEGSVGIAPLSARPGDIVCVLLGCYSAILLRQTENDTYQVVGQSYMSGANTGEALLGPLPGHLRRVFSYDDEIKRYRDALWDEHTEQVQFRDPRLDELLLNPGFQVRDQGENRFPIIKTSVEALQNAGIAAQYFDLV